MSRCQDRLLVSLTQMPTYTRGVDPDQRIYRVFALDYLTRDIQDKKLTLSAPHKWSDPYEDLPTWVGITTDDGKQFFFGNEAPHVFGQCWTLEEESDAHWRLFGGVEPESVKVQASTTVRRLIEITSQSAPEATSIIGKVVYTENDMKQVVADVLGKLGEQAFADTFERSNLLLAKRRPFQHEMEVRLLVFPQSATQEPTLRLPFEPNHLFEELMIGPQIALGNLPPIEQRIRTAGYSGSISRSELHQKVLLEVRLPNREFGAGSSQDAGNID